MSVSGLAGCGHDAAAAELRVDLRAGRTPRSKWGGTRRTYYSWAQLMRRVIGIDVLLCDRCGGRRKVLTFLTDPGGDVGVLGGGDAGIAVWNVYAPFPRKLQVRRLLPISCPAAPRSTHVYSGPRCGTCP
jgi:hypothetical protein